MLDFQLSIVFLLAMFDPLVLTALKLAFFTIVGDAAIMWVLAVTKGEFDIRLVPQFLISNILPYIGVLFITALLTLADDGFKPVFYLMTVIVSAKFGVEALKDKLTQFFKPANEPPSTE
jgi:hypothetical protein